MNVSGSEGRIMAEKQGKRDKKKRRDKDGSERQAKRRKGNHRGHEARGYDKQYPYPSDR